MVSRCDGNHLVRIVFEENDLWTLSRQMSRYFETDGTVKAA
jgi:hypothetical protein